MKNQNDILYGFPGDERLSTSLEELIEDHFCEKIEDDISWPLVVHEFKRMTPSLSAENILDDVLDRLDEEYGDPDGNSTEPTEIMKKAADVFVAVILAGYLPYVCEETGNTVTVTKEMAMDLLGLKPPPTPTPDA
jgi:hypothetical protein